MAHPGWRTAIASIAPSHPGAGRQSSSVKTTYAPRAARAPELRAVAGPAFACSISRTSIDAAARATTSRGDLALPSSTTITSNRSRPIVCAQSASRQRASDASRWYVGTITLYTGDGFVIGRLSLRARGYQPTARPGGADADAIVGVELAQHDERAHDEHAQECELGRERETPARRRAHGEPVGRRGNEGCAHQRAVRVHPREPVNQRDRRHSPCDARDR